MTNIQAAVGVAQMERLDQFISTKKKVREQYKEQLQSWADEKKIMFFPTTDGSSCWFSGIVLPEGTEVEQVKLICAKLKEDGIEARCFWKPVHLQKPYEGVPVSDVHVAESLWQRIITLPCSTNINGDEFSIVINSVKEIVL